MEQPSSSNQRKEIGIRLHREVANIIVDGELLAAAFWLFHLYGSYTKICACFFLYGVLLSLRFFYIAIFVNAEQPSAITVTGDLCRTFRKLQTLNENLFYQMLHSDPRFFLRPFHYPPKTRYIFKWLFFDSHPSFGRSIFSKFISVGLSRGHLKPADFERLELFFPATFVKFLRVKVDRIFDATWSPVIFCLSKLAGKGRER